MLTGINILLVEDNAVNQKIAGYMLNKQEALITYAMNGEEAIALLRGRNFDIVLMDLNMPGMDGFAAAKYIRNELRNQVPIIALTADMFVNESDRCLEAGMNACISKPFEVENLSSLILSLKK